MQWLKLSTAATVIVGPVLDSAGAEFTTLALADLNIAKNGGTPAAITAGTLTHVANGWYTLAFATGNVDTLGRLDITCTLATKQLPPKAFMVLPATVFDALITNAAGGANGFLLSLASNQVDVGKWLGTTVSTPTVAGVPNVNAKTWNDLTTVALPLIPTVAGRTLDVSVGGEAGLDWANIGTPGSTVSLSATTVSNVTLAATTTSLTNLPAITTGWLTAAGLATDAAQEIRDAITGGAYALSTDANGRIRIVDGTGAGELDSSSGSVSVFDFTTAAKALLQTEAEDAIVVHRLDELLNADSDIDGVAPPTVGSVFHELLTKTAVSFTYDQTTDSLEAIRDRGDAAWITATGFSTAAALATVQADTDDIQTRLPAALVGGRMDSSTGAMAANVITAAATAADLITELRTAINGGDYALNTNASGFIRVVDGTGIGEIDTTSGAVIAGSLGTQAKADVNAEVVDTLAVDTYAEPAQGTPPATTTLAIKIGYGYKAWRNKKTQTSSQTNLFNDDAVTIDHKSATSDDATTFSSGEYATGP